MALASGPPWSVLGHAELSPEDARLLHRAADARPPTTREVDEVLLRLLRDAIMR